MNIVKKMSDTSEILSIFLIVSSIFIIGFVVGLTLEYFTDYNFFVYLFENGIWSMIDIIGFAIGSIFLFIMFTVSVSPYAK